MNTKKIYATILLTASLFFAACGGHDDHTEHEDHGHSHDGTEGAHSHDDHQHTEFAKDPGPNGGRLITSLDPAVEFLLRDDRHAQLTFVDADGKAIAPSKQIATAVTGDRMSPVNITFASDGSALVSEQALPDTEGQPIILTIQSSPEASPVIERFNLKTYKCSGCGLAEYACICGH
ncbi:hypothetical protein VDG1235_4616 [Verrucomicrobiia bacterium DG1235]|nr:hypothetical protein VDG1235_4616 [Verrucomicrobiae bacterium DG1235]